MSEPASPARVHEREALVPGSADPLAQERDRLQAVQQPERLLASLTQGIPIGRQVHGQGLLLDGLMRGRPIRKAARLLAVREMRAAAPAPLVREQGRRPIARHTEPIHAAQRQEREAAGRQREGPHGKQVPGPTPGATREAAILLAVREMRAAAPAPIAREQGLRPSARQRDRISAMPRQEHQAGLRPAPVPTPGRAIREAVRPLAEEGMMAAAPAPRAPVPVPMVREQDLRPIARQQDHIPAVQRQDREAGPPQEVSRGRQAHGRGPTREHGPARGGPAAEYRDPARTRAPISAKRRHAGQRAAGVVRGEGNKKLGVRRIGGETMKLMNTGLVVLSILLCSVMSC
jgi:hypothetical protein